MSVEVSKSGHFAKHIVIVKGRNESLKQICSALFSPHLKICYLFQQSSLKQGSWSRIHEITCQPCILFQSVFNDLVIRVALVGEKVLKRVDAGAWTVHLASQDQCFVPQEPSFQLQECLYIVCTVAGSCIHQVLPECCAVVPTLVGEKIRTMKAYHHDNDYEYKGLAWWSDVSKYSVSVSRQQCLY